MNDHGNSNLTPREKSFLESNPTASLVDQKNELNSSPELKGVAGWLQFLVISLIFLGPFFNFLIVLNILYFSPESSENRISTTEVILYNIFSWGFFVVYSAISISAGMLLRNRLKKSTIPIVIGLIWLVGPVLSIGVAASLGDFDVSEARTVVSSILWTAYLLCSKRVKNTYLAG